MAFSQASMTEHANVDLTVGLSDARAAACMQGVFNFLRALWHTFPSMLYGGNQMPPIANLGVMASGLFAFLVYTLGMSLKV